MTNRFEVSLDDLELLEPGEELVDIVKNYIIEKRGSKWVLLTKDRSRVLGRHKSKADAEAQERAIEASKRA